MDTRDFIVKRVAWISVVSNILLTIGKLIVGWFGESEGVFADGIHSAADVFASAIVLLVIKIANKPVTRNILMDTEKLRLSFQEL